MNIDFLREPELEFGTGKHVDVRFGLMNYGPVDLNSDVAPRQIRVGIIGTPETVEGAEKWLIRCRQEIPPKASKQPNLFPRFPGFNADQSFKSNLIMDTRLKRAIPQKEFDKLGDLKADSVITGSVDLFLEELRYLVQNGNPDVVICAPPLSLVMAMMSLDQQLEGTNERGGLSIQTVSELDFHDLLKAKAMPLRRPIQLILPGTYDETKRVPARGTLSARQLQDEATRAWNFHTALYYKAGGIPWRLSRGASDLTVCYVGVSFYRNADKSRMLTSMAEVFNERGHGIVVRGGAANLFNEDRQPHLSEPDARSLLDSALDLYRSEHKTLPARVVLHKTSRFNQGELSGFSAAVQTRHIDSADFITITKSLTRLFRVGAYPPLRGTMMKVDEKSHLLYTRGSVDFFATYPGMYVPRAIAFVCDQVEQTPQHLGEEILALTKMNWNNTQFDNSFPITIEASRRVGSILKYADDTVQIEPRYSYYM